MKNCKNEISPRVFLKTKLGSIVHADAADVIKNIKTNSIDLIMTSPPFGLVRKKEYGNVDADEYVDWFRPFAKEFKRVLKESGSFVLDIGGTWKQGLPTKH
ncbi:MAG: DNA methyltransferase, partial [Candidatus Aminicenantales bacterium]